MNQLLDLLPVAIFVAVYFSVDIYYATGALMLAVAAQVGIYLAMRRPLTRELTLTFWASMIFGGLTLVFRNEVFIQWKPTIVNWLLAGALIGSQLLAGKNLLKQLLGAQLTLVDTVWNRLSVGWACGFFLAGVLNLVVAYNFSMDFWVSYKLFGGFGLTLFYIILTLAYLSRNGFLAEPPDAKTPAATGTDDAPRR